MTGRDPAMWDTSGWHRLAEEERVEREWRRYMDAFRAVGTPIGTPQQPARFILFDLEKVRQIYPPWDTLSGEEQRLMLHAFAAFHEPLTDVTDVTDRQSGPRGLAQAQDARPKTLFHARLVSFIENLPPDYEHLTNMNGDINLTQMGSDAVKQPGFEEGLPKIKNRDESARKTLGRIWHEEGIRPLRK
jgi:hypothetical protein